MEANACRLSPAEPDPAAAGSPTPRNARQAPGGGVAKPAMPVSGWMDRLSRHVERHPGLWAALGRVEARWLRRELEGLDVSSPIHVCGLARSGSTILLEILNRHAETASHRYRDFPFIHTPFWWNRYLDLSPTDEPEPVERAHRDRIMITRDSPEAMEEGLWTSFFPNCHDHCRTHVLDAASINPRFEKFYAAHMKKVMMIRGGSRYLAKGNYNLTRMEYILRMSPEARFVIPIRQPLAQVASLLKQHRLFNREEQVNPRAARHMRRKGHFEFGSNRRPVNVNNWGEAERARDFWGSGREAHGYAVQWSSLYGFVADRLADNPALKKAVMVVRYEDLCAKSEEVLDRLFSHVGLDRDQEIIDLYAHRLTPPTYYRPELTHSERSAVRLETVRTAARFGY